MKRFIRTTALLIFICMLMFGCADTVDNSHNGIVVTNSLEGRDSVVGNIPVSFPLSKDGETLNILSTVYAGTQPEDNYVWTKYRQMTGIDVNWTAVEKSKRAEVVQTALANRQKLDLIMRCKLSSTRLIQYGESGLILDLAKNDLLKNNAPNCWAYLSTHPDTLASVMNPDGTIYALPQVNSGAELRVALKLFVKKSWLDKVGIELPSTTVEFYNMLVAFRDKDANGNGIVDDEIPFSCADWASVKLSMFGAFGLGNRGMHNTVMDCDPDTGSVRLIAASDAYRQFLEYMNTLYSEGLVDNHTFTITTDQWLANAVNNRIGVFASTNLAALPADMVDDWVAIDEALEGPDGDKLWMPVRANFHSTGAAVIPSTCENPELVLKWLDYFWTDEGTLFYHMGIEGETFTVGDDGSYDYTDNIYDEMRKDNKSFDDIVAAYSPYPGGSNPTVEIAPYFRGGEMADVPAAAARALFEYGPTEYWPEFTFTSGENDLIGTVKSDIEKYTDEMCLAFITGAKPLSEWEDYLTQLSKLKTDELLRTYQSAVDRYHALNTVLK